MRRDWNHPESHRRRPHHRRMHSGRKGRGCDAKIRERKHEAVERSRSRRKRVTLRPVEEVFPGPVRPPVTDMAARPPKPGDRVRLPAGVP